MKNTILVGIAGGSGSGKTLVAQKLTEKLGIDKSILMQQDSYYKDLSHLSFDDRKKRNFDHPDSFDEELLYEQITALLNGDSIEQPVYDFNRHTRSNRTRHIDPFPVLILEGILVLHSERLRNLMAIKIYVETADDIRLMRRIRRDVQERGRDIGSVMDQYEQSVRPMHLKYVVTSRDYADIIIPRGGLNEIAIDVVQAKIQQLINHESLT